MKPLLLFSLALLATITARGEWNIVKPSTELDQPLQGEIWGKAFTLKEATWNDHALTLDSVGTANGWSESQVIIFLNDTSPGSTEAPHEWVFYPSMDGFDVSFPHIHMKFAKPGQQFPGTMMYMGEYTLRLVLVKKTDKLAQFEIHLSLPDYQKSYLMGQFEANIQN